MARPIKMTEEIIASYIQDFRKTLLDMKTLDGKVMFQKTLSSVDRRATLWFTTEAWNKMLSLVYAWDKEIAWNGVCYRGDDETRDDYIVSDIVVYPQEVTGATVTVDEERFGQWRNAGLMAEDERFSHMHLQGHSHVNMATSPSGTDLQNYRDLLTGCLENSFRIFLIWNKRMERFVQIYDVKKNIMFDTDDIDIKLVDSGFDVDEFLNEAKTQVKTKTYSTYTPPVTQTKGASSVTGIGVACQQTTTTQTQSIASRPKSVIGAGWAGSDHGYVFDDDDYDEYWRLRYGG